MAAPTNLGALFEFLPLNDAAVTAAQRLAKLLLFDFSVEPALVEDPATSRRRRYTIDPFGLGPQRGRNVSIEVRMTSSTVRPVLYHLGISYTPQVDTTMGRFTNWDSAGGLVDKWVKGIVFEVDTYGLARSVEIQGDNTPRKTIAIAAGTGRRIVQVAFDAQFRSRLLRLRAVDSGKWMLYRYQWIFDEEPLSLTRWETQPQSHGIAGTKTPLFAHITYAGEATVFFELTAFDDQGQPIMRTYELPETQGAKVTKYVTFQAVRGVAFKYAFQSLGAFYLYREESVLWIQTWGGEAMQPVKPFGNDDLTLVRSMQVAALTAARGGGGQG